MLEEWKKYQNENLHPNQKFEISNLGRVRSLNKEKPVILKGYVNNGYLTFSTRKTDGKRTLTYVHKAVAELFLEKANEKQVKVLHRNYDRLDNRADNLKWVTHKESEQHAFSDANPNGSKMKKIRNYWDNVDQQKRYHANKLTEVQVLKLKKIINNPNRKTRYKILAKQFGITEGQIFRIKRGEAWGWLTEDALKKSIPKDENLISDNFIQKLKDAKK